MIYLRKFSALENKEKKRMREITDPNLLPIISSLKNMWELFMATHSMLDKLSILEEIFTYVNIEFGIMGKSKDSALKDFIIKFSLYEMDNLFEVLLHFKMCHDFFTESKIDFIDTDFLHNLDIMIQSMIN